MSYQVLARKWRPRSFQSLIGQEHVVKTLSHALNHDRLHHAYLFTGTRGVGKTTIARILAKCLSCQHGVSASPCEQCQNCKSIDEGRYIDLIEVDAASRTKVEDTRELMDNTQFSPTIGKYKIYLIDEVHMLSNHSFNALLKTLEEPPAHVKFFFATTEPNKIPMTILSRCVQFHLKTIPNDLLSNHLASILTQENISFDEKALPLIAQAAGGSVRDALSLLDQAIAYGQGQISFASVQEMLGCVNHSLLLALLQAISKENVNEALMHTRALAEHTMDFSQALDFILHVIHQITLSKLTNVGLDPILPYQSELNLLSQQFSLERLQLLYQIGLLARRDLSLAPSPSIGFEMTIIRMMVFNPDQIAQSNTSLQTSNASGFKSKEAPVPSSVSTKPKESLKSIAPPVALNVGSTSQISTSNWPDIVNQIPITGVNALILTHSILHNIDGEKITLLVDPDKSNLINTKTESRIQEALATYFKQPIHLTLTIAPTISSTTPAAIKATREQETMLQAKKAFEENKEVQTLMQAFDAKVIEASFSKDPVTN